MEKAIHAWNTNIDFIGRMRPILLFSSLATLASILSVAVYGLNFGTDFAGGYELQIALPKGVGEQKIRDLIAPMNLADAHVQRYGEAEAGEFLVTVGESTSRVGAAEKERWRAAFQKLATEDSRGFDFSVAESAESLDITYPTVVTEEKVSQVAHALHLHLKKIELLSASEQSTSSYRLRLSTLADELESHLTQGLSLDAGREIVKRVDFVGPQVGAKLRNQGLLAVVYSLIFIFIYVAIRFDMSFSPGAIIATLHDIVLTIGVFSFFQIDFNITVVAALLTLIGWSLNDTIVVYDRIRENLTRLRGRELRPLVNTSINETLSRTILTSSTVFMVVLALLLLGGPAIRAFSIAMFFGVIFGTYSSIAVASPVYILLREAAERRGAAAKPRSA